MSIEEVFGVSHDEAKRNELAAVPLLRVISRDL